MPGRPGSGGIIIARADATPLHIREELAHARQATTSMRRDMVAVNEVIAAGDWRDRSARDRLNVFRKKLIAPAWKEYLINFPTLSQSRSVHLNTLLWVARCVFHRIAGHPLGETAARLHDAMWRLAGLEP